MAAIKYIVVFAALACLCMWVLDAHSDDKKDMADFVNAMKHTLIHQHFETMRALVDADAWHKPHMHGEIEAECREWQKLAPSIDDAILENTEAQMIQKLCSFDLQKLKKLAKA